MDFEGCHALLGTGFGADSGGGAARLVLFFACFFFFFVYTQRLIRPSIARVLTPTTRDARHSIS